MVNRPERINIMYHPNLRIRINQLDKKLAALRNELASCPDGQLRITKRGSYYSYKHKPDHAPAVYLTKKDRQLARDLAYKRYLELMIEDMEASKKAILDYQTMFPADMGRAAQYLFQNEGAGRLLKDCFPVENAPLAAWAAQPPATSAPHQEKRIMKCLSGHVVRSKSEQLIDNTLFQAQLAFRYEDPLVLGNEILHPDFTIRHPQTGGFIYWEHFGMMDRPQYIKRAAQTLELYALYNYIPFQNLIVTFETDAIPLDAAQINMVMDYFL